MVDYPTPVYHENYSRISGIEAWEKNTIIWLKKNTYYNIDLNINLAQSAGAVEYIDCFSAEG